MLEIPDAPQFNDEDAVYEVLTAEMSEPEIAIAAGIPIAQTRAALGQLEKAGRVSWAEAGGLVTWRRSP